LIKFADYVKSNIRKFILQQREENWKKLLNGSILPKQKKMISLHGMPTVVNTIFYKHMSASLISPCPVQGPFP
jgi:hypothetical protein